MNTKFADHPLVAVDTVVLSIAEGKLKVLLLQVNSGPYDGKWALLGGLLKNKEDTDTAAKRVLNQKANIKASHLEQLYTFGKVDRDVRGHVVSVAYFLIVSRPEDLAILLQGHYSNWGWKPVDKLPPMAFDHKEIVKMAVKRIGDKLNYSTIAYALLPEKFTLTEMQTVYEIVWDKKIDKRNFRKKILQLEIIEKVGKVKQGAFRPAEMYKFCKRKLDFLF